MAIYKRNTDEERKGKVTYNAGIVKGIIALAVNEVAGVSLKKRKRRDKLDEVKIEFVGEVVTVDVSCEITYGYNVPDVAYNIQQSVKHNIESMSKYKVNAVNVHIDGVTFNEDQNYWVNIRSPL